MKELIDYLERKIEGCDSLGGMEREKAIYQSVLKDCRKQFAISGVSKRYFLFSGQEDGKPIKYLVDDCDDRETAIAKIETEYPNFKWVMTETFNANVKI